MAFSIIAGTLLAVILGCYLLETFFISRKHPKEPVYVRPGIPLIGHLVGILKKGMPYYSEVHATQSTGIFTLPIFSFRLYVVAERRLFGPVQRQAKTVSFAPFATRATKALSQVSCAAQKVHDPSTGSEGAHEFHRVVSSNLANGPELDRLNCATTQEKLKFVDELVSRSSRSPTEIDLFEWVKHVVTLSATTGVYGPLNPYKDPKHERNYWKFHDQVPAFLSGFSRIIAPDAERSRNALFQGYEAYIHAGGYKTASGLIQERTRVLLENGATASDLARVNVGNDTAIISNYVPTAFWMVFHVFARPALLAQIREEVERAVIKRGGEGDGENDLTLDIAVLRTACPLLLSTFQESQRLQTQHANIREVLENTVINAGDRQYLLKKGSYVQLAGTPVLHDRETWGGDADSFDPYRFIRMKKDKGASGGVVSPGQLPPHCFPVWGLAPHVCPARWYAATGVMALVALMALRLDIQPAGAGAADEKSDMVLEKPKTMTTFSAIPHPSGPVRVSVRARDGWKGKWGVAVGTPNTRLQLSVA